MPIVCAYLKLLQCLQTLVKNNRGPWEFHHPVLIIHLKLNHLFHRNWRSLFSSILRNNITFYVQIFNNANALHTVGRANLMQSCKHNVNLICSYLFIDYNYCLRFFIHQSVKTQLISSKWCSRETGFPRFKTQDRHSSPRTVYIPLTAAIVMDSQVQVNFLK